MIISVEKYKNHKKQNHNMPTNTVKANPEVVHIEDTSLTGTIKRRYTLRDVLSVMSRFKFGPDKGIFTLNSERTVRSKRELDRKRRYRNLTKLIKTYPILALYDPAYIRVTDSVRNDIDFNFYDMSNRIPTGHQLTKRLIKTENPGKRHYRTLAQLVVRQKMLSRQEKYLYYRLKRILEKKVREAQKKLTICMRGSLRRLAILKQNNERRLLKTGRQISKNINLMLVWMNRQMNIVNLSVGYLRETIKKSAKNVYLKYGRVTYQVRRGVREVTRQLGMVIYGIGQYLTTKEQYRNTHRWALVLTSLLAAVINSSMITKLESPDKVDGERLQKSSVVLHHRSKPETHKTDLTDQLQHRSKPQSGLTEPESKPIKTKYPSRAKPTSEQPQSEQRTDQVNRPTKGNTKSVNRRAQRKQTHNFRSVKITRKNTRSKPTSRKPASRKSTSVSKKKTGSRSGSRSRSTKQTKPDVTVVPSPKPKVSTTITTSANRAMFVMTHPKAKKHTLEDRIVKLAKSMVGKELGYKYKTDDCYDFITKVLFAAEHNISIDEVDQHGWTTYQSILDYGWTQRIAFDRRNPNVKTGDILYVKHSPFRSRYNHWGIVYVKRRGKKKEIYVIHRGKKVFMSTLDWFIHNSKRSGQVIIFRRSTGNKQLA